jgi:hypothetical protein
MKLCISPKDEVETVLNSGKPVFRCARMQR